MLCRNSNALRESRRSRPMLPTQMLFVTKIDVQYEIQRIVERKHYTSGNGNRNCENDPKEDVQPATSSITPTKTQCSSPPTVPAATIALFETKRSARPGRAADSLQTGHPSIVWAIPVAADWLRWCVKWERARQRKTNKETPPSPCCGH